MGGAASKCGAVKRDELVQRKRKSRTSFKCKVVICTDAVCAQADFRCADRCKNLAGIGERPGKDRGVVEDCEKSSHFIWRRLIEKESTQPEAKLTATARWPPDGRRPPAQVAQPPAQMPPAGRRERLKASIEKVRLSSEASSRASGQWNGRRPSTRAGNASSRMCRGTGTRSGTGATQWQQPQGRRSRPRSERWSQLAGGTPKGA